MAEEEKNTNKSARVSQKLLRSKWIESRNFWTFFVSGTFATALFSFYTYKCRNLNGTFDHQSALEYFKVWGNTIVIFWTVFAARDLVKYYAPNRNQEEQSTQQ